MMIPNSILFFIVCSSLLFTSTSNPTPPIGRGALLHRKVPIRSTIFRDHRLRGQPVRSGPDIRGQPTQQDNSISVNAAETGTLISVDKQCDDAIQKWNEMETKVRRSYLRLPSFKEATQLLTEIPEKLIDTKHEKFYESIRQSVLQITNDFPRLLKISEQYTVKLSYEMLEEMIDFVTASKLPPAKEESVKLKLSKVYNGEMFEDSRRSKDKFFRWFYPEDYLYEFARAKGFKIGSEIEGMIIKNRFPSAYRILDKMLYSDSKEFQTLLSHLGSRVTPVALSDFFEVGTYENIPGSTIKNAVKLIKIAETLFDEESKSIFYHIISKQAQSIAHLIPDGLQYTGLEEAPVETFKTIRKLLFIGKASQEQVDKVRSAMITFLVNHGMGRVYMELTSQEY